MFWPSIVAGQIHRCAVFMLKLDGQPAQIGRQAAHLLWSSQSLAPSHCLAVRQQRPASRLAAPKCLAPSPCWLPVLWQSACPCRPWLRHRLGYPAAVLRTAAWRWNQGRLEWRGQQRFGVKQIGGFAVAARSERPLFIGFSKRSTRPLPNLAFNADANGGHAFGIFLPAIGTLRPCGAPAPVNL